MKRMAGLVLFVTLAVALAALADIGPGALADAPSPASHSRDAPTPAEDVFTPVTVSTVGPETIPVLGSDGQWHVVYELLLTNGKMAPATIQRIQVLDVDDPDRVVADYAGDDVVERLRTLTPQPATDAVIEPNGGRFFYIELAFPRRDAVPEAVEHHLELLAASNPGATEPTPLNYTAARFSLRGGRLPVLGPPLRGTGWVAINGCCNPEIVHRGSIQTINGGYWDAQRFAIDWMRLDSEGRLVVGDPSDVENYVGYGSDVLAVADGIVVDVLDELPDQVPGELPDPATITTRTVDGNHVVLDIGGGYFVNYAHLKLGTIRVQPGDRVRRGQVIANLGNSGNTAAPHLHLHVTTGPEVLGSDGFPYIFRNVLLAGQAGDIAGSDDLTGNWVESRLDPPEPQRRRFPLNLNIVDFPD